MIVARDRYLNARQLTMSRRPPLNTVRAALLIAATLALSDFRLPPRTGPSSRPTTTAAGRTSAGPRCPPTGPGSPTPSHAKSTPSCGCASWTRTRRVSTSGGPPRASRPMAAGSHGRRACRPMSGSGSSRRTNPHATRPWSWIWGPGKPASSRPSRQRASTPRGASWRSAAVRPKSRAARGPTCASSRWPTGLPRPSAT